MYIYVFICLCLKMYIYAFIYLYLNILRTWVNCHVCHFFNLICQLNLSEDTRVSYRQRSVGLDSWMGPNLHLLTWSVFPNSTSSKYLAVRKAHSDVNRFLSPSTLPPDACHWSWVSSPRTRHWMTSLILLHSSATFLQWLSAKSTLLITNENV